MQQQMTRQPWLHLRRITSGSSWIPEIDGLRFIAIAAVVLFHLSAEVTAKSGVAFTTHAWYGWLLDLLSRGDVGVRIFFVISGFILGRPFARHYLLGHARPPLRAYFLRRLTRLEPPYLINITVFVVATALYAHIPLQSLMPHLAASAVYMHHQIFGAAGAPNPVAWTLEMEVQFYILVPLLTLVFLIRNAWVRRLLLGAITILLPLALITFAFGKILNQHFWASVLWLLQYFLAGLLLSDVYVTDMPAWRPSWKWDAVSTAAWLLVLGTPHRTLYTVEPLLIALAFVGAFRGVLLHRLLTTEWLATIGGMCYSMYLWHFFIIALVYKASRHLVVTNDLLMNILVQACILLPCILLFTIAYFMLIERPCMDPAWPQKLWAAVTRRQQRPEVV